MKDKAWLITKYFCRVLGLVLIFISLILGEQNLYEAASWYGIIAVFLWLIALT